VAKGTAAFLCCRWLRQRRAAAAAAQDSADCQQPSSATTLSTDLRQPLLAPSQPDMVASGFHHRPLAVSPTLLSPQCLRASPGGSGSCVAGCSSSSSVRGMSGDLAVDVQVVLDHASSLGSSCSKVGVLSDSDTTSDGP
jgi:hypothetical protein